MKQFAIPLGAAIVAVLAACQTAPAQPAEPAAPAAPSAPTAPAAPAGNGPAPLSDTERAVANLAIDALAAESGIAKDRISVQSVSAVNWGDSSLGCPKPDMAYLSVVTPGHRVVLLADGKLHTVHEANNRAFVCRQLKSAHTPTADRAVAGASQLPFGPQMQMARQDLARRLNVPETQIRMGVATPASWEDGSLGCPEPGVMYTQAVTSGWVIKLTHGKREYQYHADATRAIPCPPISAD
jgi:hypothetical protein